MKKRRMTALTLLAGFALPNVHAEEMLAQAPQGDRAQQRSRTMDPALCDRELQQATQAMQERDHTRARQHMDSATCCLNQQQDQTRTRTPGAR